jgi:hypothetical protein
MIRIIAILAILVAIVALAVPAAAPARVGGKMHLDDISMGASVTALP